MARRWRSRMHRGRNIREFSRFAAGPWFDTVWLLYVDADRMLRYFIRNTHRPGSAEPLWQIESRFHPELPYGP